MGELLWMAGKAFLIAIVLTPLVRDLFRSYHMVDRPGKRKVHIYPIPRVGGIAIAIAYGVALLTAPAAETAAAPSVWKLLPGAALVFLTGLLDDFFSLKPVFKIAGLVAAASLVFFSGLHVGGLGGQPVAVWLDYLLTVFWLLLTSNALNLIDGLDGLCAGMGLVATLTLFGAAMLRHNLPLAHATFPLVGALLGFLCYNISPATVFLGDSGALLIGFLLGCYGMIWTQKASTLLSMLVPLLALSIPLLDVSLSVLRRFLRNQPIFSADRRHIHHRLLDRGFSTRQAVWVLYLFGTLAAALALLASSPLGGKSQVVVIVLFCVAAGIGIRQLRYWEFDMVGQFLFRGGLKRALDGRLRLERLTSELERVTDQKAWWTTLVEGARGLGMSEIRWIGLEGARTETLVPQTAPAWTFRVSLTDAESIEVSGGVPDAASSLDLIGFAETARRTFQASRAATQPETTAAAKS
ncbi:MAG TPA: MraY family glycosyltransferase [Bryobacteraceae bacterium]|jgi:UDP-GlcNAc:undecaprenyl-phosphate GlcNAc-1-phosphate transferase